MHASPLPGRRPARLAATVALAAASLAFSGCTLVGYPSGRPETAPVPGSPPARSPSIPVGVDPTPRSDAGRTYEVFGVTYKVLDTGEGYRERGLASWYGEAFHGRPTASGEPFDMYGISAAHRTLPLHTWVEVVNLDNGRRLVMKINDRGPFARTHERILDLSWGAASELGVVGPGTARVEVRALSRAEVASGR